MEYLFFDPNEHKDIDIEPLLIAYYGLDESDEFLPQYQNFVSGLYEGLIYIILLLEDGVIVGMLHYSLKNIFHHAILNDIYLHEDYYNTTSVHFLLQALEQERGYTKFCVVNIGPNNPIWDEAGFESTVFHGKKQDFYLSFYTHNLKEICELNSIYNKDPLLEDETLGDYYFRIHSENRKTHKRLFFTALFAGGSTSFFLGFLIWSVLAFPNPVNITIMIIFALIVSYGIYHYFLLRKHKQMNDYVFGFHYIQLTMNHEEEYIK